LLPVQPIELFEIDAEPHRDEKIKNSPEPRPGVGAVKIMPQLPERKEEKKDRRRKDQNLMGCEYSHNDLPNNSESQANHSAQGQSRVVSG
jgi:hypothetical protein